MRRSPIAAMAVAACLTATCCTGTSPTSGQPQTPVPPATSRVPSPQSTATGTFTVSAEVAPWRLPFPLAREVVVETANGTVVAGGLVAGEASTARAFQLDLGTGDWANLPDLAVPVHDAGGADLHGLVTVIGGGNSTEQSAVQRLGAGQRWRVIANLPTARSDLVTATIGGRVLVVGGYDGNISPSGILTSSNGRSFTAIGRLPVPVRYPTVADVDGAVWLFGGERNGHLVDAVQRIDPRSGRGMVEGHLPHPSGHGAASVVDGRVLLMGGRTDDEAVTSSMLWFDPSTGEFHRAGRLPYPVADAGVVSSGEVTYLLGGETPGLTGRVLRILVR